MKQRIMAVEVLEEIAQLRVARKKKEGREGERLEGSREKVSPSKANTPNNLPSFLPSTKPHLQIVHSIMKSLMDQLTEKVSTLVL
jgi:hypothetical protein